MLRRRGIQQASDAQAEVVRLLRDRLANPSLDHVEMAPCLEAWALDRAERGFLRAVHRSNEENGLAETLRALGDLARLHAMENGSYLPSNEHPIRFLMCLARETSDPAILSEAVEGLDRMMAPALAPAL